MNGAPEEVGVAIGRWFVEAMDCPVEEQLIRNRLRRLDRVVRLEFDLIDRILTVGFRGDLTVVDSALASLELGARRLDEASAAANSGPRLPRRRVATLAVSGALAALAEAGAWWLEARGVPGADHAPLVVAAALASLILSGPQTFRKGLASLRTRTLTINFLVTLAVAGAAVLGQWPEAAMASCLFTVAEAIEGLSLERARAALRTLLESSPEVAEVAGEDGRWATIPVGAVAMGERVRVRPGSRVPLDGRVLEGFSAVDQSAVTGESLPVEKAPGDTVWAGTLNASGTFVFEVEATAGRTTLDRIVASVKRAQAQRAPIQRFVDRFAAVYTPAIVLLAVAIATLPALLLGEPPRPWAERALVLLVIACPCALVISTPVTVVSGLTAAARAGLLIKGGAFLEMAGRVRTVAFDKTGTLTTGTPEVTDVVPLASDGDPHGLLHLAASLNAASEHPIAAAIVADCARRHDCDPLPVAAFESLVGRGVVGTVDGLRLYLGSHRLVEENAICGPHVEAVLDRLDREGKTGVVLTSATEALAVLGVRDAPRTGADEAVRELHDLGIATLLLSGDGPAAAHAVGAEVGIADVRAEMLPEDKLAVIETLAAAGPVAMVGDGVNDGPALARADIGIAMGREGADTALEIADVALLRGDIALVAGFFRLARATASTLRANIAFAIAVKVVFFALALAGKATLWMAVLADVGASLLVTANGLRLLRFRFEPTLKK
ncbi:MAG: heavy metal translocating P-type ATPase [Armatimonadota bacterium]